MAGPIGSSQWSYSSGGASSFYDHQISQSARFDAVDNSHLTLASTDTSGNRNYWTFSVWFKRAQVDARHHILGGYSGNGYSDDVLRLQITDADYPSTGHGNRFQVNSTETNMGFDNDGEKTLRDTSSWYHLVWSNNNGACVIYINGESWTTFNLDGGTNSAINSKQMKIGIDASTSTGDTFDGNMAEAIMISHSTQAGGTLTPSSFGETKNNVWVPKDLSGLSNKDFHLDFANASALGNDISGNDRDWTVSNMGADHQVIDSPTHG